MTQTQTAKHTLGPWAIEMPYGEDGTYITAADPTQTNPLICRMNGRDKHPVVMANARLIAAAPDLLAACEALVSAFDGQTDCTDILDMIGAADSPLRAAIAKARGGAE